jgi:hypothetical protein
MNSEQQNKQFLFAFECIVEIAKHLEHEWTNNIPNFNENDGIIPFIEVIHNNIRKMQFEKLGYYITNQQQLYWNTSNMLVYEFSPSFHIWTNGLNTTIRYAHGRLLHANMLDINTVFKFVHGKMQNFYCYSCKFTLEDLEVLQKILSMDRFNYKIPQEYFIVATKKKEYEDVCKLLKLSKIEN